MGYVQQFEAAKKDNTVRQLTAKFVEWKEKGQSIVGRLVARVAVTSQLGGGSYNQYLFETDDGLVKCAFGRATDNEAGQMMGKGGVYSITYRGQEAIGGGRKINRFDIFEVEASAEVVVGGSSDVPF